MVKNKIGPIRRIWNESQSKQRMLETVAEGELKFLPFQFSYDLIIKNYLI